MSCCTACDIDLHCASHVNQSETQTSTGGSDSICRVGSYMCSWLYHVGRHSEIFQRVISWPVRWGLGPITSFLNPSRNLWNEGDVVWHAKSSQVKRGTSGKTLGPQGNLLNPMVLKSFSFWCRIRLAAVECWISWGLKYFVRLARFIDSHQSIWKGFSSSNTTVWKSQRNDKSVAHGEG